MFQSIYDKIASICGSLVHWEPLTPGEILILIAILVALFSERIWKQIDEKRKRGHISKIIVQFLKNLRSDLVRIRDERNPNEADDERSNDMHIKFSATSSEEIGHYFYLLTDLILPNAATLNLPNDSKTIDLFDHYKKNLENLKTKGHLKLATVNRLLDRIDEAVAELS